MTDSLGALCTDYYVNQKLGLKMDMPSERETVLHFFDRIRAELPDMARFRRYSGELALESAREEGEYRWLALRRKSLRSGHVNAATLDRSYRLHELVLEISPYYLTISPLDVDFLELLFGFDLECKANHNEVVFEALFADTPFAELIGNEPDRLTDVQPIMGMTAGAEDELDVSFEVKTRTTAQHVRSGRYRTEPISIYMAIRRAGPVTDVEQLKSVMSQLASVGERLVDERLVPNLLLPINRVIIGSV